MKIINASPEFGAPLNEQEVKEFLSNSIMNLQLRTVNERGEPNIHPIWFYYDTTKR